MTELLGPAVQAWLTGVALPGRRITAVRRLTGGYSNDNCLITTTGGAFVLRRYLRRNSCALETALAARLARVVPVPEVVAADPTGDRAGEPVLLSTFVPGRPLGDVTGARAAGAALARIGSVTFSAPGFFAGGTLEPDGAEPTAGLDHFVKRCLDEGNADGHLTDDEQRKLMRFAEEAAPALTALAGSRHLVHADYNPKNLLVDGDRVTAVLDWEFAFSGSPLFDIGNMLRDPRPPGFAAAVLDGFRAEGGDLPPDWRRLSRALDLYSLADFLTRPVDHRYFARAVERIRELVA